ncbi:hypothetical protein NDU88_008109 [Pleurodeles waltl]|uniref:Uncharacterized protein n=1 Tax=Pleurodeles waltl TaxID=8319 RepID=A0AAV7SUE6_PLEWA|nr:hypothetical protein NDU88_008109 [Pleurodeles waltl]
MLTSLPGFPLCPACCSGGRTPCLSVQLSSSSDPHRPPPDPKSAPPAPGGGESLEMSGQVSAQKGSLECMKLL